MWIRTVFLIGLLACPAMTEAVVWQGDLFSLLEMARRYETGNGAELDYVAAFELYRCAADSGNASAQYKVGEFYQEGKGVSQQDDRQAAAWFEQAIRTGNDVRAMYRLGMLLYTGKVGNDPAKGIEWIQQSAMAGYPAATVKLKEILGTDEYSVPAPVPALENRPAVGHLPPDREAGAGLRFESDRSTGQLTGLVPGILQVIPSSVSGFVFWFGVGVIGLFFSLGFRMALHESLSGHGILLALSSALFAGAAQGYLADTPVDVSWMPWVLAVLLLYAAFRCIAEGRDRNDILRSLVIAVICSLIVYQASMLVFYLSGALIGGFFLIVITVYFVGSMLDVGPDAFDYQRLFPFLTGSGSTNSSPRKRRFRFRRFAAMRKAGPTVDRRCRYIATSGICQAPGGCFHRDNPCPYREGFLWMECPCAKRRLFERRSRIPVLSRNQKKSDL